MRRSHWLVGCLFALLLGGCAGTQMSSTAPPAAQTRQALAPTGPLRVAFLSGVLYATRDPATGELKGVAVDLGKELARRVGAPFQPVLYANPAAIVFGAKSGEWDVALMGISAERAAAMDFSPPYIEVEQGYLVRAGLPIATNAEVDSPGTRVGVVERGGADLQLSKTLKNAAIVRTKTVGELDALLGAGNADVIAATKTFLFDTAARHPGSRVLEGRLLVEPVGMGVPRGRDPAAAAYVARFVQDAKAAGLVRTAIDGARLRGVVVAQ